MFCTKRNEARNEESCYTVSVISPVYISWIQVLYQILFTPNYSLYLTKYCLLVCPLYTVTIIHQSRGCESCCKVNCLVQFFSAYKVALKFAFSSRRLLWKIYSVLTFNCVTFYYTIFLVFTVFTTTVFSDF